MSRINVNLTPHLTYNPAAPGNVGPDGITNAPSRGSSENRGTANASAGHADRFENPDLAHQARIRQAFQHRFQSLARDRGEFHAFFAKVYGNHDDNTAESLRQRVLAGDQSWMPRIEFVPRGDLQGANGAYSAQHSTVYLAGDLRNDPNLAARTFAEEVGHHIDTKVRTTDTPGDEGEMFRRLLYGERLTPAQEAEIRNENDHGSATINGRPVQVEFFLKKIKKTFKKATKSIGNGIRKVAGAVTGVARKAVDTVTNVATKAVDTVTGVARKAARTVTRLASKGMSGIRNLTRRGFRATTGLARRALRGAGRLVRGIGNLARGSLGRIGQWMGRLGSQLLGLPQRLWSILLDLGLPGLK